jgi:hypothetical protein
MGKENAPVGNRGLVIDLDMAILLNREGSLAGVDFRTVSWLHIIQMLQSDPDIGHPYIPIHYGTPESNETKAGYYIPCPRLSR